MSGPSLTGLRGTQIIDSISYTLVSYFSIETWGVSSFRVSSIEKFPFSGAPNIFFCNNW
jgi:hypothetical protein